MVYYPPMIRFVLFILLAGQAFGMGYSNSEYQVKIMSNSGSVLFVLTCEAELTTCVRKSDGEEVENPVILTYDQVESLVKKEVVIQPAKQQKEQGFFDQYLVQQQQQQSGGFWNN